LGTQVKLYLATPRIIQPKTWTRLVFDKVLRDDAGMVRDLSFIVPKRNTDFIWSREITWADLSEIPPDDDRPRQFMSRFMRDLTDDDTGTDNEIDTPGRDWDMATWQFHGFANQRYCAEVWHDHHEQAQIDHAQFVATTWDY